LPAFRQAPAFFFMAEHPALDFLNTRPVLHGQAQEFLPDFSALLRWFAEAGLLDVRAVNELAARWGDRREAAVALARIREFRESLRTAVLAVEPGAALPRRFIAKLNEILQRHPLAVQLVVRSDHIQRQMHVAPRAPAHLLGILAHQVADLFAGDALHRIRKCEACVLHFCDTTKNGTRRWCSMQACGNRAKVAAYAARQRRARR